MTIQRQYSLPNCTLLVEGLGDAIATNSFDLRPPLSVVINAECRLLGQGKVLSGGREFLDSLVKAINQYTQELLSGFNVNRPQADANQLVQIQRVNDHVHRLRMRNQNNEDLAASITEVDLNTVQLFDLVDAVDQMLADTQTLPDLTLDLKPLSRRDIAKQEPITKQVVPAAIGLSSLAAAAFALSLLPVPKVEQPKDLYPVRTGTTTGTSPTPGAPPTITPAPTASPSAASPTSPPSPSSSAPTSSPNLTQLASALTSAPEITAPADLDAISQKLQTQLEQNWASRTAVTKELTYQVGVAKDGTILGYNHVNAVSLENAAQTPLLGLIARQGDRPANEPLARYKVVFTPSGKVEVVPWRQATTSPVSGITEITDTKQLESLLPKLRNQINNAWSGNPTFKDDLLFKVRVKQDGTVVDFSPENDAAARSVQDTPLPKLGKAIADNSAPAGEPLALFKVVFTAPNGSLEITPWRGWQNTSTP